MGISTHVLDTSRGRPARGVRVSLERHGTTGWEEVARGVTDDDGRIRPLLEPIPQEGNYRLHFGVEAYFLAQGQPTFFPVVEISFRVGSRSEHYHVPLLLTPFGYSTYRGS